MSSRTGLKIGKVPGRRALFRLPPELAVETTAIVGRRGQGKTSTGVVIVEELARLGVQIAIIDPTDVWHGLRSSLDGARAGLEFLVLGGAHGDLPLEASAGKVLADFVVEARVPVVLSLRHLRKKGQRQLVTEFSEQLYHRKGEAENRTPLLIVIDEASAFVPQRVMGETARTVGAIEDLVRRGRAAGIGVLLIDQRPASVNKDVLTQLSTLVCHQITAPQDRKALDEWIRQHDSEDRRGEFNARIPILARGEAWFWAPGLDVFECVQVRQRSTFDSSRTPGLGETPIAPQAVAELDLAPLRDRLAETIRAAEANDPRALKRQVIELRGDIRNLNAELETSVRPDAAELDEARVEGHAEGFQRGIKQIIEAAVRIRDFENALSGIEELLGATKAELLQYRQNLARLADLVPKPKPSGRPRRPGVSRPGKSPQDSPPARRSQRRVRTPAAARELINGGAVSGPQNRILETLLRMEALGVISIERAPLAALSGASSSSSSFTNNLGVLRSQLGLIDYPSPGLVCLTELGRDVAPPSDVPATLAELHDGFAAVLSGPQARILRELLGLYPEMIARDELAERVGASMSSSSFTNNLGRMRTIGLIDYPRPGWTVGAELLFPRGMS